MDENNNRMNNLEQAITDFKNWKPVGVIIGVVDLGNGNWGSDATFFQTKEEFFLALPRYYTFVVKYLTKDRLGEGFYRSEYEKQKTKS